MNVLEMTRDNVLYFFIEKFKQTPDCYIKCLCLEDSLFEEYGHDDEKYISEYKKFRKFLNKKKDKELVLFDKYWSHRTLYYYDFFKVFANY